MPKEFIRNIDGRTIYSPEGSYSLSKGTRRLGERHNYLVYQDEYLPVPDLKGVLTARQYRYLHAHHIATTLAAITSADFPGMNNHGIAYPFEYSRRIQGGKLNKLLIEALIEDSRAGKINLVEIGGQEGEFQLILQNQSKQQGVEVEVDSIVVDLDLMRRFPMINPPPIDETTKFVQADAHHLHSLYRDGVIGGPDVFLFMNVTKVIFDPFAIFSVAWDILPINGILVVGTNYFGLDLPFTPMHNGVPALVEQKEPYHRRNETLLKAVLTSHLAGLKKSIPDKEFKYYSGESRNADIANLSKAIYQLPSMLPRFDIQATLKSLGYNAKTLRGDKIPPGNIMVLKKLPDQLNPFRLFNVAGISQHRYHVGESMLLLKFTEQ